MISSLLLCFIGTGVVFFIGGALIALLFDYIFAPVPKQTACAVIPNQMSVSSSAKKHFTYNDLCIPDYFHGKEICDNQAMLDILGTVYDYIEYRPHGSQTSLSYWVRRGSSIDDCLKGLRV